MIFVSVKDVSLRWPEYKSLTALGRPHGQTKVGKSRHTLGAQNVVWKALKITIARDLV